MMQWLCLHNEAVSVKFNTCMMYSYFLCPNTVYCPMFRFGTNLYEVYYPVLGSVNIVLGLNLGLTLVSITSQSNFESTLYLFQLI